MPIYISHPSQTPHSPRPGSQPCPPHATHKGSAAGHAVCAHQDTINLRLGPCTCFMDEEGEVLEKSARAAITDALGRELTQQNSSHGPGGQGSAAKVPARLVSPEASVLGLHGALVRILERRSTIRVCVCTYAMCIFVIHTHIRKHMIRLSIAERTGPHCYGG